MYAYHIRKTAAYIFVCVCFVVLWLGFFKQNVFAYDFSVPNNKFGMGMAQPHFEDIKKVAELVNSNGGDWGYVTFVIQDNDRNVQKWQEIFDLLRDYHLIPIIRIATHPEGESWARPSKDDAGSWADFLNSLNWVVKNRYVILFNEPNHGSEWGSEVDASGYADIAKTYAGALKAKNSDFFIMMAGLDASAPQSIPVYQDEHSFLQTVLDKISVQDFEKLFDGWASHSYPNPGFAGSPWANGRGSVRTYEWELQQLRSFGVTKDFPVFITETGWQRGDENTVAENYKTAFENVWDRDKRVIAVTPFIFDYQGQPFLNFSWKKFQSEDFYAQYYTVQSLSKTKGEPERIDTGVLVFDAPVQLVASSNYHFRLKLKNTGQAIWDKDQGYILIAEADGKGKVPFEYFFGDIKKIKPFQEADVDLYAKTNNSPGKYSLHIYLQKNGKKILQTGTWNLEIVPLPSLKFSVSLYPKFSTDASDFEIQIFDANEGLVYKKKGLKAVGGLGYLDEIQNIIPGRTYRVVILKSYYLPRQDLLLFKKGENSIAFKRMFPLDFNKDGHFDWSDLGALFKHLSLMKLLLP